MTLPGPITPLQQTKAPSIASESTAATAIAMPRCQLTASQMTECQRLGLCFNCEEKFVPGHRCKWLFLMEVVPDDVDDPLSEQTSELEDPTISLHALFGIQPGTSQT